MTITLPTELKDFVRQEVASGAFESESALMIRALELFREMKLRYASLRADIQRSVASADQGELEPLNMEEIKAEVTRRSMSRRAGL